MAIRAIESLNLEAIRMETFAASYETPLETCRQMVHESDVFIGIYGGRYGYVSPNEFKSVSEIEFEEARQTGKDILIYIKQSDEVEPKQTKFLKRADDFEGGYFRRPKFRTLAELKDWIKEDLIALLSSRFVTTHVSKRNNAQDEYRAYVSNLYGKLTFAGVAQTPSGLLLPLSDVYITPTLREVNTAKNAKVLDLNIEQVVSQFTRTVIVGVAGSGKTTLLKHLACVTAERSQFQELDLLPLLVPIISLVGEDSHSSFYERLCQFIAERTESRFEGVIREAIGSSKAIVLLDGLDEIVNSDYIERVLFDLEVFCQQHPNTRVILTTRPKGWRQITGFFHCEIQPFSEEQISRFAKQWSAALGEDLQVSQNSDELVRSLVQHPDVLELAKNPLFLTLLAFLHRQGYRLPTRRVELYDAIAKMMIESWDRARSLSHTFARQFRQEEVEHFLSQLALNMIIHSQRTISRDEVMSVVANDPTVAEPVRALEMLEALTTRIGLLLEVGDRRYSFIHVAFQEFFAAKAIASMEDHDATKFITEHFYNAEYEEVVRLALSWMEAHGRHALVPQVAEELLNAATN